MKIKSFRIKRWYNQKVRLKLFEEGQRVWFYNPRRKIRRTRKLQNNWEGPFLIVKKLNDVVFCIQKSNKYRKKIVHADRLAPFTDKRKE